MRNPWFWKVRRSCGRSKRSLALGVLVLAAPVAAAAGDAPAWLHALAAQPVSSYPNDISAVRLLDERIVTISSSGEIKTLYRRAHRILRAQGRDFGRVVIPFDSETPITQLKAWCIPAQGKDYEAKNKDAFETGLSEELVTDARAKVLTIPAADPGSVIGYEYEQKDRPYLFQSMWWFQERIPVREARFTLRLPPGWEYKAYWVHYPRTEPVAASNDEWCWELHDIPAVKQEPLMPPPQAIEGRMVVNYYPTSDRQRSITSWRDLGAWYMKFTAGRSEPTPEIKQRVAALATGALPLIEKIRALVGFVQREVRYVAIEIGVGGFQPHAAGEVFAKRYGDCKDKVTLLGTMLREIGVEWYYVFVHTTRGVASPEYPPAPNFNHVILAIRVPQEVATTELYAVVHHEKLGNLLLFDPTARLIPVGYLPPSLQGSYGLLATEEGGEMVHLPLLPPATNRLTRIAKLNLSPSGTLSGEVQEIREGEPAFSRRAELLQAQSAERAKVLETFLSRFMTGFILTKALVENLEGFDDQLVLRYSFVAESYAKTAGNLLLVRPRVLGQKSSSVLEGKERQYPIEFDTPSTETDSFEIALPSGYEVEELPPPVQANYSFASYRSKVEVSGGVLRYSRVFQVKDIRVPTGQLGELKKFYRQVAFDESTSAVLRSTPR